MPARQFFIMYRAMDRVKAIEYFEQCDLHVIPTQEIKYYESLKDVYRRQFDNDFKEHIHQLQNQRKPLSGEEAREQMFSFFAQVKGEVPHA